MHVLILLPNSECHQKFYIIDDILCVNFFVSVCRKYIVCIAIAIVIMYIYIAKDGNKIYSQYICETVCLVEIKNQLAKNQLATYINYSLTYVLCNCLTLGMIC